MSRIVIAGSINQDLVVRTPRIPVPGESIIGGALQYVRGGKGANQAVAVARLGGEAVFVGRVGSDAFGAGLLEGLRENGVDTAWVGRSDGTSGVAIITVDAAGENAIVVAPGANADCVPEDASPEAFKGAQVLLCQLETSMPFVEAALSAARAAEVTTILDAAPARHLETSLLALVDVLTLNETEARIVLGLSPEADIEPRDLSARLLELGPRTLVLKLGADGGLSICSGESVTVSAPEVDVVDTTGAGDAFTGALAVGLAEGLSLAHALELSVCAGSLACTVLGAQPSMPTRDAVESLRAQALRVSHLRTEH